MPFYFGKRFFLCFCIFICFGATSQNKKWTLGLGVNFVDFENVKGWNFSYPYYLSLSRYFSDKIGVSANVANNYVDCLTCSELQRFQKKTYFSYGVDVRYFPIKIKFLQKKFVPFVSLGFGQTQIGSYKNFRNNFRMGGGLVFFINDFLSLNFDSHYKTNTILDSGDPYLSNSSGHFIHTITLNYGFNLDFLNKKNQKMQNAKNKSPKKTQKTKGNLNLLNKKNQKKQNAKNKSPKKTQKTKGNLDLLNKKNQNAKNKKQRKKWKEKEKQYFKLRGKKRVKEKTKTLKFAYNAYNLTPESKKILNDIATILKQFPNLRFAIVGHTDNVGSLIYNTLLSFNRAKTVQKYLISKGIPKENLIPKAYGFFNPLSNNKTEKGRSKNRRVEIILENE